MKWTNQNKIKAAVSLTAALGITVMGVVASSGGQTDPLVTLSYLTQTLTPSLVQEAKTQATTEGARLETQFDQALAETEARIEQKIAGTGSGGTTTTAPTTFTLVTLAQGEILNLPLGSEVLLRIGTATVVAENNPALVNTTTGSTISNGTSLEKNQLYLATIEGHSIKATTANTKVMFRGGGVG